MTSEEPSPAPPEDTTAPAGDPLGAPSGHLRPAPDAQVPYTLRVAAGWAWRLVAVAAALWVVGQIAGALTFALVAVFVGGVITSLVKPLVDRLDRVLPRGVAVALSLVATIAGVIAIFSFIVAAFVNQIPELSAQVADGFASLRDWLRDSPLKADSTQIDQWLTSAQEWLKSNGANLAGGVLGGVGTVGELLTGLALAVFAAIFFLHDGGGIYAWIVETTPKRVQPRFRTSGHLAWGTFSA
ncbi:MAG TPA: AI-2E family transporter, partial [Candidatus Lustribacter sp.]|nr:AI-2E family transporter [Candidatus Lustribacter sp.]